MNKVTKIVIVGAGGLGREVLATIKACNGIRQRWNVVGFVDADSRFAGATVGGVRVLGDDEWCRKNKDKSLRFICAIGDPKARRRVVEKLTAMKCQFASVVHPDIRIPDSVQIGDGTVIMAGTQFTTDVTIGAHAVVYLNCSITHDVRVGHYSLVASGCNLSGGSVLEEGAMLGTDVSVLPGIRIGAWAIIGAGSVVVHDIPSNATAVGTPCRVIRTRNSQ